MTVMDVCLNCPDVFYAQLPILLFFSFLSYIYCEIDYIGSWIYFTLRAFPLWR